MPESLKKQQLFTEKTIECTITNKLDLKIHCNALKERVGMRRDWKNGYRINEAKAKKVDIV